jgi:tol-pal system protein YbgF
MRIAAIAVTALVLLAPIGAKAQDSQTLADIRQELTVLNVEVQRLKREMSTTGGPSVNVTGTSVLDRISGIEAELQRLTAQTEQLDFRIKRVVEDGTNRIGDLEFRLVELEGGDVSKLGETSTLGGVEATPPPVTGLGTGGPAAQPPATELAIGEESDFNAASTALSDGDNAGAAQKFAAFIDAYPGSPLAAQANLQLGRAHDNLGDTRAAARAYLASFTADSTGPDAPEALFQLGAGLGRLGQVEQACVTLGEVGARFPLAEATTRARAEMAALGCS